METIPGPVAPPQPTVPVGGINVVTPPDIGKAPMPAPPAEDLNDPFGKENLDRIRTAVPEQREKPAAPAKEVKPPEGKPGERARDEAGKFVKVEPGKETPAPAKEAKTETPPAPAKTPVKPPEVKPPEVKPPEEEGGKITGWQMARKHEATIKQLNIKIADIENKLKAAPQLKLDDHPEWKEVNERLTKAEQRRQQLEDDIRWYDYEKSAEYQDKFFKPYATEYQRALTEMQSFRVNLPDGQSRPATKEDFQTILNSATPAEALEKAEKLFGLNAGNYIVGLRNTVLRKAQEAHDARQEFATKGAAELKEREARAEREADERAATFNRLNEEASKQYPQWFTEAEGDEEGNMLLKMGNMLVDAAFGGQIEDPDTKQMRDPTPEEMVKINSMLRMKAGAFDRMIHRHKLDLKSKDEKIAELEAELRDYRESTPPAGGGAGGKAPTVEVNDDLPEALR